MTHNRCIDCHDIIVKKTPIDRHIPPAIQKKVDEIWEQHVRASHGKAFNGQVFCVNKFTDQLITGDFVEYKYLIAQLNEPELFDHLQIISLAVTGLLHWKSEVLLGLRNKHVAQNKNQWELAPAGGVDSSALSPNGTIDLFQALNDEALEEIELDLNDCPQRPVPRLVIHDPSEHVIDIVLFMELDFDEMGIKDKTADYANDEYDQLGIYGLPELLSPNSPINLSSLSRQCLNHIAATPEDFNFTHN